MLTTCTTTLSKVQKKTWQLLQYVVWFRHWHIRSRVVMKDFFFSKTSDCVLSKHKTVSVFVGNEGSKASSPWWWPSAKLSIIGYRLRYSSLFLTLLHFNVFQIIIPQNLLFPQFDILYLYACCMSVYSPPCMYMQRSKRFYKAFYVFSRIIR